MPPKKISRTDNMSFVETDNIPLKAGEEKKLDIYLKWPNSRRENTNKMCTPVQPARVGAKLSSVKSLPGRQIDVQDAS